MSFAWDNKKVSDHRKVHSGSDSQPSLLWELDSMSFAWDNRWGMPLEAAAVGAFAGDDVMRAPTSAIFQQAPRRSRLVSIIGTVQQLRVGFYNFGLLGAVERPVNPKKRMAKRNGNGIWTPGPSTPRMIQ